MKTTEEKGVKGVYLWCRVKFAEMIQSYFAAVFIFAIDEGGRHFNNGFFG